ncbi:methyltransferase [Spirillospora sp. CA-294931]|uniref:methyltransferase n=1 Tax=Spirillospora sp. CA-294931 TaxID=3240042 RepID=UPI003D8D20C5
MTDPDPTTIIWDAIGALSRFAALATMADLGVAEELRDDGPLTPDDLAKRCGADPGSLARVLRELAGMGVVSSAPGGRYALTPAGETMCADSPDSMLAAVQINNEPEFRYAMGHVPRTVRQGRAAFVDEHGPLYDYLSDNPALARLFDTYMTSRSVPLRRAVAERYDFSSAGTLVDVGGGKGHFLGTILAAHPNLRGVLFDREHVVDAARENFVEPDVADRCEFVSGDFFEGVHPGGDVYLLGSVIHNWSDDDAVTILSQVRGAMAEGGRVLLLEYALPDGDEPHVGKDADIRMLALFGDGAERTVEQYRALLGRAGLRLERVIDLPGGAHLIEALV